MGCVFEQNKTEQKKYKKPKDSEDKYRRSLFHEMGMGGGGGGGVGKGGGGGGGGGGGLGGEGGGGGRGAIGVD